MNQTLLCRSNFNQNSSPALGEIKVAYCSCEPLQNTVAIFFLTMFLSEAEKCIAKLVSLRDSVTRF